MCNLYKELETFEIQTSHLTTLVLLDVMLLTAVLVTFTAALNQTMFGLKIVLSSLMESARRIKTVCLEELHFSLQQEMLT